MAGYSITSQMQGPDIKVSLFPDAMQAGINAGNSQKTTGQAIAEGLSSGVKNAMATYEGMQDIQIKQNQIDQQPVINQLRQQQAEEGQLNLEKQRIQTQAALENKQQILDNTRSQLEDEGLKIQEDLNKRKREAELDQRWQEAQGPLERKQLIFSGEYADVFANDPKKYQQYGGSLSGYFNPVETATFKATMAKSNVSDAYTKRMEQVQAEAPIVQQALYGDNDYTDATTRAGVSPDIAARELRYEPQGKYAVDEQGKQIVTDKGLKLADDWDPAAASKSYDIFYKGKRLVEGASSDSYKRFVKNRDVQNVLNGTYKNAEFNDIDNQAASSVQQQLSRQQAAEEAQNKQYAPSVDSVQKTEKLSSVDPITDPRKAAQIVATVPVKTAENTINLSGGKDNPSYDAARTILGVPQSKFIDVKPAVQNIFRVLESPKEGWFSSYSTKQKDQLFEAKKDIIDKLGNIEYQTSPDAKKLYNAAAVEAHNQVTKDFQKALSNPGTSDLLALGQSLSSGKYGGYDIQTLVPVKTPEELCRVKNAAKYNQVADNLINNFNARVEGAKKAMAAAGQLPTKWASVIND